MSLYMVPALVGLVLKLWILGLAVNGRRADGPLVPLLVIFVIHNLIELVGYALLHDFQTVAILLRAYYIVTIIGMLFISVMTLHISQIKAGWSSYTYGIWAAILVLAILLGNSVIAGHASIGYSLTAVEGDYFGAFVLYSAVVLSTAIVYLLIGMRRADSELQASRCRYALVGAVSLAMCIALSTALNMFGLNLNLAILLPLATTLVAYLAFKGTSEHQLTDIRRFVPFSVERRTAAKFMQLADAYTLKINKENAFNELRDGIERQAILYTIEKCDGNISETTRMMGLQNRSTLYSMMKRLGIDPPSVAKAKQQG